MWIWDDENMLDCMIRVVGSSLPVLLYVCVVCGRFSLWWSSTWLMGAVGRGSQGQHVDGDSAA